MMATEIYSITKRYGDRYLTDGTRLEKWPPCSGIPEIYFRKETKGFSAKNLSNTEKKVLQEWLNEHWEDILLIPQKDITVLVDKLLILLRSGHPNYPRQCQSCGHGWKDYIPHQKHCKVDGNPEGCTKWIFYPYGDDLQ